MSDSSRETRTYKSGTNFVPAIVERKPLNTTIAPVEVTQLLPQTTQAGHARQDDSAISHAKATLLVASAYVVAAGMITAGLLLMAWLFRALGSDWATYTFTGLVVWGVCILAALWGNRKQSLHHSPTGISHHEIDSRERIARHAIDTHAELLLKKWELDNER